MHGRKNADTSPVFEVVAAPPASSRRALAVAGLVVIALVAASLWLVAHRLTNPTTGDDATSAPELAGRIGCERTYRDAERPGSSRSAGSCTVDGAEVELRVYRTLGEAMAWLEGAQGQSGDPGTAGWGGVGGTWAVRITNTRDADTVNTILTTLQQ